MNRNEHTRTSGRDWQAHAACRPGSGVDPDLFFPTAGSGPGYEAQVIQAKTVCERCPVRTACLQDALARIPYGIAGGLTEAERHALRRANGEGPAAHAEAAGAQAQSELEAVARAGPQPGLTARTAAHERSSIGRSLLATGRTAAQVAQVCNVTTRTAQRWASATSPSTTRTSTTVGCSHADRAHRALSTARFALADSTPPEGAAPGEGRG